MAYFLSQVLFAAAFYPLFLIMLSGIACHLTNSNQRWKNAIAYMMLTIAAIATYASLTVLDSPANEIAIYVIASTMFFVFFSHILIRVGSPKAVQHHNLVYCLLLIFLPFSYLLESQLTHLSLSITPSSETARLLFLLEFTRWPLTLLLAVWTTLRYRTYWRLILIILGLAAYFVIMIIPFLSLPTKY